MFAKKYEECLAIPVSEEAKSWQPRLPARPAGWSSPISPTTPPLPAALSPPAPLTLEGPDYNEIMMQIWLGQVSVEDGLRILTPATTPRWTKRLPTARSILLPSRIPIMIFP